uniref:Uncharacterized protein n=1 Tax=Arundo donax TaxID=35708 RepID=A0A0A9BPT0_ARUDO
MHFLIEYSVSEYTYESTMQWLVGNNYFFHVQEISELNLLLIPWLHGYPI